METERREEKEGPKLGCSGALGIAPRALFGGGLSGSPGGAPSGGRGAAARCPGLLQGPCPGGVGLGRGSERGAGKGLPRPSCLPGPGAAGGPGAACLAPVVSVPPVALAGAPRLALAGDSSAFSIPWSHRASAADSRNRGAPVFLADRLSSFSPSKGAAGFHHEL